MINKNTFFGNGNAIKWIVMLLAVVTAFAGCGTVPPKNSTSENPAGEAPHSEKILLREGDVLKITVPGAANLDTVQPIRRDGKLNLTLVGEVDAAGLTPDDLQKKLVELYASQISSKEITGAIVVVPGVCHRRGDQARQSPIRSSHHRAGSRHGSRRAEL